MDIIDKLLKPNEVLRESIPTLVEAFTMYYGEENREYINNKFNDIMIIGFQKNEKMLETFNAIFNKMKMKKISQLMEDVSSQYDLPLDDILNDELNKCYFRDDFLRYPLFKVKQYIERLKVREKYDEMLKYVPDLNYRSFSKGIFSDKEVHLIPKELFDETLELLESFNKYPFVGYRTEEIVNLINPIMNDVNKNNIDQMILEGKLDELYNVGKTIVEKKEELDEFCLSQKRMNSIISYLNKEKEVRNKIQKKHYYEFLLECKDKGLLNPSDVRTLELSKQTEFEFVPDEYVLPESLDSSLNIEFFRKEYDDKLADPGTPKYLVDIIKSSRINYFDYKMLYLGDNYEDYLNDPLVKEKWPSEELINEVKESFLKHKEAYEAEVFDYYLTQPAYNEFLEEAEKKGLLNKGALFNPAFYLQNVFNACVFPNVIKDGDNYRLFPQVSIGISNLDYLDETIVHELNHVLEMSLLDCDVEIYSTSCGWELIGMRISQSTQDKYEVGEPEEDGKYTAFNEIINEFIAQKITTMMHEKGFYMFSDPETAKVEWASGYEHTTFLAKDFFEEYHDAVMASRRDNNMQIIMNKVGKDNFEELNELFHEFHRTFPGVDKAYLQMDLEEKNETVLTKKYHLLEEKRDKILDNMREYSMTHGAKLD